ncbi:surface protease GP63 [Trypanosoma theileri]|uniref:Leishmanolysin-like peptidase n=1 Tax=Trypanosoma theileri TaxID=67003 RepID=A0A1X0NVC3_9TRYP|nr:surface protease GP63 [Trypanosoma theileri]ORC88656.1 surface protease GP63 [Trypanosoma theileri]
MKSLIFIEVHYHFPKALFLLSVFTLFTLLGASHVYADNTLGKSNHYRCMHDEVAIPLNKLPYVNVGQSNPKLNLRGSPIEAFTAAARENIRFRPSYALNSSCTFVGQTVNTYTGGTAVCRKEDILTPRKNRTVMALVESALDFLGKALLVDPQAIMNVPADVCGTLKTPAAQYTKVDFVVFVTANPRETPSDVIAWARACARDPLTQRPVIGHINFIPSSIKDHVGELEKRVAMHEITHSLGFTDIANTAKGITGSGGFGTSGSVVVYRPNLGKNVTLITTPKVVEVARKHFGCPTLDGVEVEDAGGPGTAGSHWKKRILFEEVLVGVVTSPTLFYSSFTLAFLQDLGYYTANFDVAEDNFRWGRNSTCRFLYNKCNDQDEGVNEFCFGSSKSSVCTNDRLGFGRCDNTEYNRDLPIMYQYFGKKNAGGSLAEMDYCPFIMGYTNVNCINEQLYDPSNLFGSEINSYSRCFDSNMITGAFPNIGNGVRCFPFACTEYGQLIIRVQGQTAPCPENGDAGNADTSKLIGVHGKIKCPRAVEFCGTTNVSQTSAILPETLFTRAIPFISPVKVYTALDFTHEYAETCADRVKCADNLTLFPVCRFLTKKVLDCFGRDCESTMNQWFYKNKIIQKCQDPKTLAQSCLDGWIGVNKLCAVASAAYPLRVQFSLFTTLFVTLMVTFLN